MSFSSDAKAEICQNRIDKRCCAVAESYGVLLYCNTFSPGEIKISTSNAEFAERLPKLFRKAFGISFDIHPSAEAEGSVKKNFIIKDPVKLETVFNAFDLSKDTTLAQHLNYGVIENECCKISFLRGAFLAGGSVTSPEKRYHLEMTSSHHSAARETMPILQEFGFSPKESSRAGNALVYFKQADAISELLALIGAPVISMDVLTAKVEKEMRNTITRQINCDSANADKTVAAAQEQITAIKRFANEYGLDALPEHLKDAALLRITNPEASLADLAKLSSPKVSKSCLSHRLKKIMSMMPEEKE